MSYILDALRKSDQLRQRGTPPTLLTTQAAAVEAKRPGWLLYGLLAAVLLGVGVAIGWLQPWQQIPVTPVAAPVAPKSPEPARQPAPQPSLPEALISMEPVAPPQQPQHVEPVAVAPIAKQDVETPPQAAATIAVPAPVPAQAVQEVVAVTVAELPHAIQQEIPAMQVSLHAYSAKPKGSLVSINNQLLRDGDVLAPGLKLEQITPDGMIFSYKGYRFHRGVK